MFLDRERNPIGVQEFMEKVTDWNYTVVGKDTIGNVVVLTVWTGIVSEENTLDGVPFIYETVIRGGELSGYNTLYADEFDAFVGHLGTVDMVKEILTYGN